MAGKIRKTAKEAVSAIEEAQRRFYAFEQLNDESPNLFSDQVDAIHKQVSASPLTLDIRRDKYYNGDDSWAQLAKRVALGVYQQDTSINEAVKAYHAIKSFLWVPAGRILAGAGTAKRVTLNNCYVTGTIDDSLDSIMRELTNFALTMQQGGGDGADFSTIRPVGARLTRTGTAASGPLPFMDMWNAMCTTIKSSGDRRGAMMGVMCDTHPDLPAFIKAKQTPGRLTNFNLSVLISDAFMEAAQDDDEWLLYFNVPPVEERPVTLTAYDFEDDNGVLQYVYSIWKACDLWNMITEATYKYSEPGTIFIDRINDDNNLWYCEEIRATNPCGEQPLPPHGACTLGHVNLAMMVSEPFTARAEFNWNLLNDIVKVGVRFLDNVIDVTNYPLEEQEAEQQSKRRIGLGHTGLADAFVQLGVRYGSVESQRLAEKIQQFIASSAYSASIELARERGAFPLFVADRYIDESKAFVSRMPTDIKEAIRQYGIRNGVILTIAPTGTTSIAYNNVSGGLEPIFAVETTRKVLQKDNTHKEYSEYTYSAVLWKLLHPSEPWPTCMVTTDDLTVQDHIGVQAAMQRWVDASVSKTINVPESMPLETFRQVYDLAYKQGCKGCTTYRPSDVRGSILTKSNDSAKPKVAVDIGAEISSQSDKPLRKRPKVLNGKTVQIKWPGRDAAYYLTLNSDENGDLFEMLIQSKDGTNAEWTTALSLMITAIFRRGGDISFVPYELKQIQSLDGGVWVGQKYVGSLPAYIGQIIEEQFQVRQETKQLPEPAGAEAAAAVATPEVADSKKLGRICPTCHAPSIFKAEGCDKCMNCGYSKCG